MKKKKTLAAALRKNLICSYLFLKWLKTCKEKRGFIYLSFGTSIQTLCWAVEQFQSASEGATIIDKPWPGIISSR